MGLIIQNLKYLCKCKKDFKTRIEIWSSQLQHSENSEAPAKELLGDLTAEFTLATC